MNPRLQSQPNALQQGSAEPEPFPVKTSRRRLLLAGAALGLAGCGSKDLLLGPAAAQAPSTSTPRSRLFVANAQGGSLSGNLLTLVGVAPDVVWFEDRPGRQAGRQSTASFIADWGILGFLSDPPNAVLEVGGKSFAVILTQPVYDSASQTLGLRVESDRGATPLSEVPATLGANSLFIDNAGIAGYYDTTVSIRLATPGAFSYFSLSIRDGNASFVLDGDPNSCSFVTRVGQLTARDSFVAVYDGESALFMGARLQGQGTFTLVNIGDAVALVQFPAGAATTTINPGKSASFSFG